MALGRIVAVGGMTLSAALGMALPATAAPIGPGSAAECKAGGGQVVEPAEVDRFQEQRGIDDDVDLGSCVGGRNDGLPIIDPAAAEE